MEALITQRFNMPLAAAIFFCFLSGGLGLASEGAAQTAPFIWWSPAPVERLTNGRVSQILTLEASPNSSLARPEAWLRVTPLSRYNQPGDLKKARWLRSEWASSEPWTLAIQASEYLRVDVFAKVEIEGRPHFAQIRLLLYGNSKDKENDREGRAEALSRPEFHVSSNGEFYWPQTGNEFTFALEGMETAGGGLEIWSAQGELLDRARATAGAFKYTPAHDPALDRAGSRATKPLVFVARNPEGGSASFTLVVRRSRLAGLNLEAGLLVFTAAFLFSGLGVGLKRLRELRLKERPC